MGGEVEKINDNHKLTKEIIKKLPVLRKFCKMFEVWVFKPILSWFQEGWFQGGDLKCSKILEFFKVSFKCKLSEYLVFYSGQSQQASMRIVICEYECDGNVNIAEEAQLTLSVAGS